MVPCPSPPVGACCSVLHSGLKSWLFGKSFPFPYLLHCFHGLSNHLTFYSAQRLYLFEFCVKLSRLLVGCRTQLKAMQFHFISFQPNSVILTIIAA